MTVTSDSADESVGAARLRRLARLAEVLSAARTVEEVAAAAASEGAEELGADMVSMCLLSADGDRAGPPSATDQAFLQVAADLCGQAVHRARLHDYQQRALARQRFLGQAAGILAQELDMDLTLRSVARLAVEQLADVCAVCLIDDDDVLRPVVAEHRDPDGQAVVDKLVARQPAITNPRLLAAARTGEAIFVPDTSVPGQEPAAEDRAHAQLLRALDAHSSIVVAMRARGHVVGLLLLLQTAGSAPWVPDDLRMAEGLAAHAGLALDNARLYAEQLELVDNLQTALASHKAIEQAKGVLATRLGITIAQAFDRMRRHARARRRRIQDVADDVVGGRDDLHD